jgi:hypothetical protein
LPREFGRLRCYRRNRFFFTRRAAGGHRYLVALIS